MGNRRTKQIVLGNGGQEGNNFGENAVYFGGGAWGTREKKGVFQKEQDPALGGFHTMASYVLLFYTITTYNGSIRLDNNNNNKNPAESYFAPGNDHVSMTCKV